MYLFKLAFFLKYILYMSESQQEDFRNFLINWLNRMITDEIMEKIKGDVFGNLVSIIKDLTTLYAVDIHYIYHKIKNKLTEIGVEVNIDMYHNYLCP